MLPAPRDSYHLPFGSYLSNRGFFLPEADLGRGRRWLIGAGLRCIGHRDVLVRRRGARASARWRPASTFRCSGRRSALIVGLPLLAFVAAGMPLSFDFPKQSTFNFTGGFDDQAGVPGALSGAVPLHGDLHRRDRARRHPGRQQGPDRGGLRARPAAGLDAAPGRRAAGDARHHPAAHQPVSEPHQELLAGGRDRLSRPRGDRRHGPEPDRPGGRGRGDLDGRLSRHQPRDLGLHELVQRRVALVER